MENKGDCEIKRQLRLRLGQERAETITTANNLTATIMRRQRVALVARGDGVVTLAMQKDNYRDTTRRLTSEVARHC